MVSSAAEVDAGLKEHAALVRRIARSVIAKLPPSVEIDDLIQVGMIALADVLRRFDAQRGIQFATFAEHRIRGAMLDELRQSDEHTRGMRKHQRTMGDAMAKLQNELGRRPLESEIAMELELSLPSYQDLVTKVIGVRTVHFEDLAGEDVEFLERCAAPDAENPLNQLQERRRRMALSTAIEDLPEYEKRLMLMYYEDAMRLDEIGGMLKISHSYVSVLLARTVTKLRLRLRGH